MTNLLRIISALFHPLLIPTYLFGIFVHWQPSVLSPFSEKAYLWMWGVLAITTFLIPVISITFLRLTRNIPNFTLESRKDRMLPFIFITFFYVVTTYMFIVKINVGYQIGLILIITTILIGILTLITSIYKISIHSAGVFGALGFLMAIALLSYDGLLVGPVIVGTLLSGIVSSARLALNVHSPKEVLFGAIVGFTLCFGGYLIFV